MENETFPITPPPELVREWAKTCSPYDVPADHIATQAARWGADQELESFCEWLETGPQGFSIEATALKRLRADRRPKPPSLKAQAFAALQNSPVDPVDETLQLSADSELIIRRALALLEDNA